VSHDQIDDAAFEHGWQLVNVRGASGTHPAQIVYAEAGEADPLGYLQVVEDARLGVAYLSAEGPAAESLLLRASESLACHPAGHRARLLADGRLGHVRRGLALWALVGDASSELGATELGATELGATQLSATELERLRELLRHPERGWRVAVLTALAYRPVVALRPELERASEQDEDPGLRLHAAQLLLAMPS
jgi:hypothetical protein